MTCKIEHTTDGFELHSGDTFVSVNGTDWTDGMELEVFYTYANNTTAKITGAAPCIKAFTVKLSSESNNNALSSRGESSGCNSGFYYLTVFLLIIIPCFYGVKRFI